MKQYRKKNRLVLRKQQLPLTYNPHNANDIRRLEKDEKFKYTYDRTFNRSRIKTDLRLQGVAVLNGQLGVFAQEHIKVNNKTIGCYAGKRVKVGKENPDSDYIFEITDDDGKDIEYIDGMKVRDWTNFVNHSATPNLDAVQREIKGKFNIYFYAKVPIKKGEQLLFDYGSNYFNNRKHLYIHASDDWRDPAVMYTAMQRYYLSGTYIFDHKLNQDLKLNHKEWVVPSIFLDILNNDVKRLEQRIKQGHPVDLLAYAVNKNKMSLNPEQAHLTALMFAAYLGKTECIAVLIKHRADINRCMLAQGFLPFTILCKGKSNNKVVNDVGQQLLKKMHSLTVIDVDKCGILYYAVMRDSISLVKRILDLFKRQEVDVSPLLFKGINFIDCAARGQFEILNLIFIFMQQSSLKKPALNSQQLKKLSKNKREQLMSLLKIFK